MLVYNAPRYVRGRYCRTSECSKISHTAIVAINQRLSISIAITIIAVNTTAIAPAIADVLAVVQNAGAHQQITHRQSSLITAIQRIMNPPCITGLSDKKLFPAGEKPPHQRHRFHHSRQRNAHSPTARKNNPPLHRAVSGLHLPHQSAKKRIPPFIHPPQQKLLIIPDKRTTIPRTLRQHGFTL